MANLNALAYAANLASFQDVATHMSEGHHFMRGDIRDDTLLARLFSKESFDCMVHQVD